MYNIYQNNLSSTFFLDFETAFYLSWNCVRFYFLSIQFCDAESVFRESSLCFENTLAARMVETIGMSGEKKKSIVRKQLEKCLKISIYSVQSFEAFLCMSEYKLALLKCISRTILLAQDNKNNHQQHKNCISRIKKNRTNLLHKTWMIGGENLMYVVHSVYFVSSPELHRATKCE